MSTTVQQVLDAYDSLPEAEKHEATVEILRHNHGQMEGDLPESTLINIAGELFQVLDAEEASHDPR